MITAEVIKNIKPSNDRLESYLNQYKNETFTYEEFIDLNEISFEDKMWILLRLMSLKNIVLFSQNVAQECARYADQDAARYAQYAARCAQETVQDEARYVYQDDARYAAQDDARYIAKSAAQYASHVVSRYFILNLTLNHLK